MACFLWPFLVLAVLQRSSSQSTEQEPCTSSSILRMIRDFAPECISACPSVCLPLEGLISSVMMGQDPFLTICPNWQTFYCMALPDVLESCTPLLDAAKTYVGINLPRSGEQLMDVCEVSSTSTTRVGTQTGTSTSAVVTSSTSQELADTSAATTDATSKTSVTSTATASATTTATTAAVTATVTATSIASAISSTTSSDPREQEHALLNRAPDSLSISQERAAEPTEQQTSTERRQNQSEEVLNASENFSEDFDDFRDGYVVDASCPSGALWALLLVLANSV
ncbi:unnamed protein product [Symbiodinium sp. CCMP2456]|nr:unnamed protein product [Symbiodinium sp. CCMP2456]